MAVAISLAVIAQNGLAYAATVGLPTAKILAVRPANTGETSAFATAVTAVDVEDIVYNSVKKSTYLSVTATATVITALNA